MTTLGGALATHFADRILRFFVVLCIAIGLMIATQALYYRHRVQGLKDELAAMGERVSELRLESRHAAALLLQYEQRCEL